MFIITFSIITTVWYFSAKETCGRKFKIQTAIKKDTRAAINAFKSRLNKDPGVQDSVHVQILQSPENFSVKGTQWF